MSIVARKKRKLALAPNLALDPLTTNPSEADRAPIDPPKLLNPFLQRVDMLLSTSHPVKKPRKTPAKKKKTTTILWTTLLPRLSKIVCGIDMSLTNPGLCLLDPHKKTIQLYCFRNRKCERSDQKRIENKASPFCGWLLTVMLLSDRIEGPNFCLPRIQRYQDRVQTLVSLIGPNVDHSMQIGIEAYAYQSAPTEGDTMLKELGGILRLYLLQQGHHILEIPPTSIKKVFSTKGSANKTSMYEAYESIFQLPDLFHLMHLKPKSSYTHTPHPIEDIVDALAVALTTIELIPSLLF